VYKVIAQQWGRILSAARQYTPALIPFVLRQPMRRYLPSVLVAKLLVKCLIRKRVAT
jgi:hypothetical protein